jgi:hypothetical protein
VLAGSMPLAAGGASAEGLGGTGLLLLLAPGAVLLDCCKGGVTGGAGGKGHKGASRLTSRRTSTGLQACAQGIPAGTCVVRSASGNFTASKGHGRGVCWEVPGVPQSTAPVAANSVHGNAPWHSVSGSRPRQGNCATASPEPNTSRCLRNRCCHLPLQAAEHKV